MAPAAKKSWTFMVYMAGDNNLDPEGVQDLKEMKKIGSTNEVNVIAQFDRARGHTAKRYFLRQGGKVDSDAVANVGEVNTGDPKRLDEFISWGISNYPADHYCLVLWNHGQGWDDTDIFADERFRSFSRHASRRLPHAIFQTSVRSALGQAQNEHELRAILIDDNAKDFLDNKEMKQVVGDTAKLLNRNLDILGMDACLMSMIEVGYQIHGSVDFTVGSEQVEPGGGWPYDLVLTELTRNPDMAPRDLSGVIVDQYLASYTRDEVTQAACDLSKAGALATAIGGLAKTLKGKLGDMATRVSIMQARNQVQSYEVEDNIDLVDFCSLLSSYTAGSPIAQNCDSVIQAVKSYVIKQGYKGSQLKHSNGVAIYFPIASVYPPYVSPLYAGLDFNVTGWGDFLEAYNEAIHSRS
jgi:Clostripain family